MSDKLLALLAAALFVGIFALSRKKAHPMIEAAAIIGLFIFAAEFLD